MIIFLTTDDHKYTIKGFIESPVLDAKVKVRGYSWLLSRPRVPFATYIFTDIERLAHHELNIIAKVYTSLKNAGFPVYNNPALVRCRASLLHHLYEKGINQFHAHSAVTCPKPSRFPVFIKHENNHRTPNKELIPDQKSLESVLEKLELSGTPLRDVLVIEFYAKPIRDGIYQKHSEFRIGEQYLPYDSILEEHWCAQRGNSKLMTESEMDSTINIMQNNIFSERVRPAFELARIEYGRADFGFVGDNIAIYEINTNPSINPPHKEPGSPLQHAFNVALENLAKSLKQIDSRVGEPVRLFSPFQYKKQLVRLGAHTTIRRN